MPGRTLFILGRRTADPSLKHVLGNAMVVKNVELSRFAVSLAKGNFEKDEIHRFREPVNKS